MTTLKVSEMSCEHCVKRITQALNDENLKFEISLEKKTVIIDGSKTDVSRAIAALDDVGYETQYV